MKILLHMVLCRSLVGLDSLHAATSAPCTVPTDTLGTVEITATRPKTGITAATPLQCLDATELRRRGITDTADALRRMAGVNVRDYGGAGGLKTVSVRGLGTAHTAVAYDGICMNDVRNGQTDLQRFSVDRLTSLELQTMDAPKLLCPVRNLAAALINLRTLTPENFHKPFAASVALRQGSFGLCNTTLNAEKKWNDRTWTGFSADWMFARNNYPFTIANGIASTRLHRTNSRMQGFNTEINVFRKLKYGRIEGKAYFFHNYRHLPGQVIYYVNSNNERLKELSTFEQARWTHRKGRSEIFAAVKYDFQHTRYMDINAQYPNGRLLQIYKQYEIYTTAGISFDMTSQLKAAYATDVARTTLKSNLKSDNRASRTGWLQSVSLQWQTQRLNVTLRGVHHWFGDTNNRTAGRQTSHRFTPSASASLRITGAPTRIYLRAGYKENFRMPTFSEAYFYHLGDTKLSPEHTKQFNAGMTLQASPAKWWSLFSLTADAYCNKVTDRIVSVPYNLFVWRTVNMGEVRSKGFDLVTESHWTPHTKHKLVLTANYSMQIARDRTSRQSDTYNNQLAYTPRHNGAASLAWENPWLSFAAHTTFSSARWSTNEHIQTTRLSPYSEWGFAAYRTIRAGKTLIELRADLINAFNQHYEVVRRYPMPGRAYRLSAKINF